MPKTINCTVVYDETTRQLQADVTLNEFITAVPTQTVVGQEIQTITLFKGIAMTASDQQAVVTALARALLSTNRTLVDWQAAADNLDEAEELIGATVDPASTFTAALDNPTP